MPEISASAVARPRETAPPPARPGALRTPRIKVALALDAGQVLAMTLDETTYSRIWIASPERLLSAEVPTQTLRKVQHAIRAIADDDKPGFDGISVVLNGILASTTKLIEPSISVMPKPISVNGRDTHIGARRR